MELKTPLIKLFSDERVVSPDDPRVRELIPANWKNLPQYVVFPENANELSALLQFANEANVSLLPYGGGTQLQTGYPPSTECPYLMVSLSKMNQILDYQPEDMTITCEPGTTLQEIQTRLATRRQFLALDVPLSETATMGGIVSTNLSGFWRPTFGTPRDLLIGVRAVTAKGEQVRGGGKVVKNVAGYDICKLFTGAWGTLGILTELTFRVRPLPDTTTILTWRMENLSSACTLGLQLHHAQLAPVSIFATNEIESQSTLVTELQGTSERVSWQAEEFKRRVQGAGVLVEAVEISLEMRSALLSLLSRGSGGSAIAMKISCLPSDCAKVIESLEGIPGIQMTAICGTGSLSFALPRFESDTGEKVQRSVPKDANLIWTKLDTTQIGRLEPDIWGAKRGEFLLHQSLKKALDPENRFSPGRFYGKL